MLKIKPSKTAFLVLLMVSVALSVVCGMVYFNRAARLHVMQARLAEAQKHLDESTQIALRKDRVEQEYLDAQAKLSILEKGVSTKAYVPTFLRQVEDLGRRMNLQVVGIRPTAPVVTPSTSSSGESKSDKKVEPYDRLDVAVEVNGKYSDVINFVYQIQSFPKIIAVNDIQVSPIVDEKLTGSPKLSVKFNTTAFILKEEAAPRAKDGSVETASSGSTRI